MMQSHSEFEPQKLVENQIQEIQNKLGKERALVAVSGGVDSSTCAALVYRAIGNNLLCVILDDAFMREGEPENVANLLSQPPLNLPMKILNVQERFLAEMQGLRDAEEKRRVFRETFYKILSETAKHEDIRYLVQGTILADIIETTGGVKTQHNVLSQIGISTEERYGFQLVEPLKTLFKSQVREVARYIGLPKEIAERQPFPGPGLSVRAVGEIRRDKLESLKKATAIVEDKLLEHEPSQYFAVIIDNLEKPHGIQTLKIERLSTEFLHVPSSQVSASLFEDKATGVKKGKRVYGEISTLKVLTSKGDIQQPTLQNLIDLQSKILDENPLVARVFYTIQEKSPKQPYVIAIRAVKTKDFLTAKVADIPWSTLNNIGEEVLAACNNVSAVYYDVTPKPTATIEME